MEENDVKGTCGWAGLEFEIEKDEKLLIQNMIVVKISFSKLTRCRIFF